MYKKLLYLAGLAITLSANCYSQCASCNNQTVNVSIPLPDDSLHQISVKQADFSLPAGLQSFAFAVYEDKFFIRPFSKLQKR